MLVTRWLLDDVPLDGDPSRTWRTPSCITPRSTSAKYEPDGSRKGPSYLVRTVKRTGAEGVIFAAPSFCDPALLDRPMLQPTR